MSDLKVSYDRLEESSKNLKRIQYELEHTGDHQRDIRGILGSGDIAHAMDDFANNWDYHRHKLLDQAKAMQEATEKTVEAFGDLETKLSSDLKGSGKK
ncbi:MAG: hypothetical protein JO362_16365 [Streptomycetaceae bacterium]|nr:hypothetical protein [Streptomycetaceae bacterium]